MDEGSQRIVVIVGLPGSGKSTWLDRYHLPALSSDAIRHLLADDATDQTIHARAFLTMRYLLRHRLAIGRRVTYMDATHLTPGERRPYIEIAGVYGSTVEAQFFAVPVQVCLERNRLRARIVPEDALCHMAEKLVPPEMSEGFHRITVLR